MNRFENFPSQSQIWIYQAEKPLTNQQKATFESYKSDFLANWDSHGTPVTGDMDLLYDLFIVVCANDVTEKLCGRSIASSVQFVKDLEAKLGATLLNRRVVAYRAGEEVKSCSLEEFRELFEEGAVSENTIIFNNAINSLSKLETEWEIPVKDSWIARTLPA